MQRKHETRSRYMVVMGSIAILISLLAASLVFMTAPHRVTAATDLSSTYNWKPLKIGGGGWVTGLVTHPTTPGLVYARTDVGGAYRWDEASQTWSQLLLADRVPNPQYTDLNVDSIAVSKTNSNVVYVAVGTSLDEKNGRILKSTNRGQSWTDSGQRWFIAGNADYRMGSERLAVDPNNENIVYFGSRTEGLWLSTDGAATWSQVSTGIIPPGTSPSGVKFVTFDPQSGTVDGKTRRIYVGVAGKGVYTSTDAGASWSLVFATDQNPYNGFVGADGIFYFSNNFFNSGGAARLYRYTPSTNEWKDITPGGNIYAYFVATDPFDAQRIIVTADGVMDGFVWRSTNRGDSYTALNISLASEDIPWPLHTDVDTFMANGMVTFDPHTPDQLWFGEGIGVWRTTDINDDEITWHNISMGIEEMVPADVIAPPGGKPVSAVADRSGFYHENADDYPEKPILTNLFTSTVSLDYSGGTPSFLAAVSTDHRSINPDQSGYSTDGGRTWTQFSGSDGISDLYGGNIAVSANNTNNMVWLPSWNKKPYVTTDRGATWTKLGFFDSIDNLHGNFWWINKKALDADKVEGGTFYVYSTANGGSFYRSTDGGQNWVQAPGTAPTSTNNDAHVWGQLRTVPGYAGHIWMSTVQGGLHFTENKGDSWTKLNAVQEAKSIGFGKALPGAAYPMIFIHGKVADQWGIWRSSDKGGTWDKVATYPAGIFDVVRTLNGDMNIAGRVYIGIGGSGFVYGDSSAGGPINTPIPTPTPTPLPTQQINVAQASSPPTIDGNGSDSIWSNAASSSLTRAIGSPSSEFAASYQTAWDSNNLYFLVKVTDASLSEHTDVTEIYLDPNHSGGTSYDSQDMQYIFPFNSTTPTQWNGGVQGTNISGIVQANQTTSTGYQTEISIPWARLGLTPSANAVLGLDLDVWQDSGSSTKKKLSWNTNADNAWTNPSVFGKATLQDSGSTIVGTGLLATYYNNVDLSGSAALTRTDATVNFNWGTSSPGTGININNFSVRWTGQVQATVSGNYTFATSSDDGIRLWVNGQQVINNWTDHGTTLNTSPAISLTAGQKYSITLEFYERGGHAVAKLLWTPPGGSQQVIPQSQLYPTHL